MDKKCPSCGNTGEFRPTLVNEEYICEECETEFSEISQEAYTAPNYRLFCERVITKMRANVNDAIIASAIGELSEGYINDGPENAKGFIEKLSGIASDLYNDYKAGYREEYDFSAIMEGVERMIELYDIQNPEDDSFRAEDGSEEGEQEQEPESQTTPEGSNLEIERPSEVFGDQQDKLDPAAMIDDNAPPAEKTEHLALANLKGNVENLKNTLAMLDAAEQQERETDGMDRSRLGGEGAEHEDKEAELMAKIQDAVGQLQAGLEGYLQNEVNAHYNAPEIRNKVDDIASQVSSGAMDEAVKAQIKGQLEEVCEAACGMLDECGYPVGVTEDAQLVSQDSVDAQLATSIDTSTQEMGNTVDEAVVGGQNVEADLLTPVEPMPYDLPPEPDMDDHTHDNDDPELLTPATAEPASAEDELAYHNDVENIPLDNTGPFNMGDIVNHDGEDWTVKGINEGIASLESMNGETTETHIDNLALSSNHDGDSRHEHADKAGDNLEEIWKQMESSIEGAPLLGQAEHMFNGSDFRRKKRGLELETFGDETMPIPTMTRPKPAPAASSLDKLKKNMAAHGAVQMPPGAHPNDNPMDTSKTLGRGLSGGFGDVRYEEEELETQPVAQPNSNVQI